MNSRYVFSFLRIMKTPGMYPIMKDWQAFIRMHFIHAAFESGLLGALETPRTKEELIGKLHVTRPGLLDALLEVGVAAGELSLKDGSYRILGKRSKAVIGPDGDMLAALVQANVTYYGDAYRRAGDRLQGAELGDNLSEIGDLVARFSKISEPIIRKFVAGIVGSGKPLRVLDVGCGSGVLLKTAFDANPQVTGLGLDVDEAVVRQARHNLLLWRLADRFDIIQGDVRDVSDRINGSFDVIMLCNLLYYFATAERPELLRRLRDLLAPRGVLAVAMGFRGHGGDLGMANLNLVNNSLKGLTPLPEVDEVTSLLAQCGFGDIKVHRFMPASTYCGLLARMTSEGTGP